MKGCGRSGLKKPFSLGQGAFEAVVEDLLAAGAEGEFGAFHGVVGSGRGVECGRRSG